MCNLKTLWICNFFYDEIYAKFYLKSLKCDQFFYSIQQQFVWICLIMGKKMRKRKKGSLKKEREIEMCKQNVLSSPGREILSRLFLRFMRWWWWWYISELYSRSFRWPLSSWMYWRGEKSVYNAWVPLKNVDVDNNRENHINTWTDCLREWVA